MICFSLFISFFIGIVFPFLSLSFFPEIIQAKGIEAFTPYASIYLTLLFVIFSVFLYFNKKSEIMFVKDSICSLSTDKISVKFSIFLLAMIYVGRVLYMLLISDSPYTLLVNNGNMLTYGILDNLINYFYIVTNFKFYPLFQGIIILSLPRRILPFFFIGELAYACIIFSKSIIFINFIAIFIFLLCYTKVRYKKINILFIVLCIVSSIILMFILREIFGQLRQGYFSIEKVDFYSVLIDGVSRIQSLFSVFYAERILNDFLYGKTLCHVVGYIVPDSLIKLPIHCRNIDEPIIIYYYGLTDIRIIDKDMLTFWGEPFANFGIAGVLLFVFIILLSNVFTNKLGPNQFGLILVWVILINCLIAHNSWSAIVGNIYLSFVFIWILQQMQDRFWTS